jgi:hypothetical protein
MATGASSSGGVGFYVACTIIGTDVGVARTSPATTHAKWSYRNFSQNLSGTVVTTH